MAADIGPEQGRLRKRSFSFTLHHYCFGGSYAGFGNEDNKLFEVSEYDALSRKVSPTDVFTNADSPTFTGGSSSAVTTVNIAKSLVGIGMLTLPRALADATPVMGVVVLLLSGSLSVLSFFMLGYCAHLTGAGTLPKLWDMTVGPSTTFLVEVVICIDTLLSCVAFTLIIGDYTSKSLAGLFPSIPEQLRSHSTMVMVFGVGLLLPLCLIRRLSLLRYSSLGGLVCTLYVILYVVSDSATSFSFGSGDRARSSLADSDYRFKLGGMLRSIAIFSLTFMAHHNAPAFYADLRDCSPSRFAVVSSVAFGTASLIYVAFGICGLSRFGAGVPGNALLAYPLSKLVLLMWLGMGLCVTASFPLVFNALRGSLLRLAGRICDRHLEHDVFVCQMVTVVMVLAIVRTGAGLEDLSAVVSLTGAVGGVCLGFIFPGVIMLNLKRRKTWHYKGLASALVCLGIVLAVSTITAVLRSNLLGL